MAIDLNNGYQRKDGASASNIYYGYTWKANASDGENVFAIRRVNSVNGVETVTWTNGDPISYNDDWTSRTYSFGVPSGTLGLTMSSWTSSAGGFYIAAFTWSAINGVSKYYVTASSSQGVLNTFGAVPVGQYSLSSTSYIFNQTAWTQNFPGSGTYSFTVRAENVAGSIASSITIYLS
jgi:hypothetical protein